MDCKAIRHLLPAYEDKDLTGDEAVEVEKHLLICRECREMKSALSASWSILDAWEDSEVPRTVGENLVARVKGRRKTFWIKIALPVAAAILIIFGVTLRYMDYRNESTMRVPHAPTEQISREKAEVNEDELIADLHILQDEEFFDVIEELVSIDYLPLVEEPAQTGTDGQGSSLSVITA